MIVRVSMVVAMIGAQCGGNDDEGTRAIMMKGYGRVAIEEGAFG
jgi:hypothetical protein